MTKDWRYLVRCTVISILVSILPLWGVNASFGSQQWRLARGFLELEMFQKRRVVWKAARNLLKAVDSSWNVMAEGDAREGKWRGNWRMEWVARTLHATSEHGLSSTTTADAHTSTATSRLNWRPLRFKWTRPFRRKKNCGFCACVITFQTQSNSCCIGCRVIRRRSRTGGHSQ